MIQFIFNGNETQIKKLRLINSRSPVDKLIFRIIARVSFFLFNIDFLLIFSAERESLIVVVRIADFFFFFQKRITC